MKDKEGRTINKEVEQRSRREEHFKEILNTDPPAERPDIPIAEMLLSVNINPHSKAEISSISSNFKDVVPAPFHMLPQSGMEQKKALRLLKIDEPLTESQEKRCITLRLLPSYLPPAIH